MCLHENYGPTLIVMKRHREISYLRFLSFTRSWLEEISIISWHYLWTLYPPHRRSSFLSVTSCWSDPPQTPCHTCPWLKRIHFLSAYSSSGNLPLLDEVSSLKSKNTQSKTSIIHYSNKCCKTEANFSFSDIIFLSEFG